MKDSGEQFNPLSPEARSRLLEAQLERLLRHLESMRVAQYMEMLEKPSKLILTNFIAGIARGLGIALGATLVFALMLDLLRRLILLNIPGIGTFIAEIIRIVEAHSSKF
ncbi:MAG: DUF5665 domain-containing protein [Sporomusaceae bacterium]|nr:DUF5665 domain-containing protein [Sporomusaceae bacterium]